MENPPRNPSVVTLPDHTYPIVNLSRSDVDTTECENASCDPRLKANPSCQFERQLQLRNRNPVVTTLERYPSTDALRPGATRFVSNALGRFEHRIDAGPRLSQEAPY